VIVAWQPPIGRHNDSISYQVFYRESTALQFRLTNVTYSLNVTLSGLVPSTAYDVFVVAIGERGVSPSSYIARVTTDEDEMGGIHSDFSLMGRLHIDFLQKLKKNVNKYLLNVLQRELS